MRMPLTVMCCSTLWSHFQSLMMSALMWYLGGQCSVVWSPRTQHLWHLDLPHVACVRLEGGGQVGRQHEAEGEAVDTLAQQWMEIHH